MYRGNEIGVVVPAYNEEDRVGGVIATMPAFVDRIYAIDDGSTDGTWTEIRRQAERENAQFVATGSDGRSGERVVPLRHDENRGVGGAIKTGYQKSLADGMDVTAVMGGDGQMDPDCLEDLLDPIVDGHADYAKGNRLRSSEDRAEMPRFRLAGNAVLTLLTKVASGYWRIGDPQNGYTAISRDALERVDLERMYEFYGYCNDLLVRLNVQSLRVADVPMPASYGDERSHIRYSTYVPRVSAMLLRTFLWRLYRRYLVVDFHPLALLYGLGTVGGLSGLVVTARRLLRGKDSRPLPLATLLLSGFVLVQAMVYDRDVNAHLNVVEPPPEAEEKQPADETEGDARERPDRPRLP